MRSYQFFTENIAVIRGTEEDSLTVILSTRKQTTRNRINHHPTDYSSVMLGCNPRGNMPMTTHKTVTKTLRWRIILFVSEILFFISFLRAFFHRKPSPTVESGSAWPPTVIQPFNPLQVPLLNTSILLASRLTVSWAHYRTRSYLVQKKIVIF
jgi:heme/copper-type cytochrome/quinol oxidase subunit 3